KIIRLTLMARCPYLAKHVLSPKGEGWGEGKQTTAGLGGNVLEMRWGRSPPGYLALSHSRFHAPGLPELSDFAGAAGGVCLMNLFAQAMKCFMFDRSSCPPSC